MAEKILITGGCGFAGSTIAIHLKNTLKNTQISVLDNLRRRGSELILNRLVEHGINFIHGDVRNPEDFPSTAYELMIECSADPSVLSGYTSSPQYLLSTNLIGAMNCLEYCRRHQSALIFLSTSRVYPVIPLSQLCFHETETRFELEPDQPFTGASEWGISEEFPIIGARSLYGSTKLAAELLIEEYRQAYNIKTVVNRCGVLAGPWQMGKSDQGIFTFWLASHYFKKPLKYIGFNGSGKQVRDLLHAEDLAELICSQIQDLTKWNGFNGNVGGGRNISLSLKETTLLCQEITGNWLEIASEKTMRPMDIPCYISDCRKMKKISDWNPKKSARDIFNETLQWIITHESSLRNILD